MPSSSSKAGWTSRNHYIVVGLAVFLLALGIRLPLIGDSLFFDDEALHYTVAREIVEGRYFPRLGPQVTIDKAHTPGPLYFYVLALSQLFSRAPEAGNALIALLGSLAVWFSWDGYRRLFGLFGATIGGVLLATYPWSTLFSDRVWNPNLLPVFIAVSFWLAIQIWQAGKNVTHKRFDRKIIWLIVLCSVMPQIHLSAIAIWTGILWLVRRSIPSWNKRVWKWALFWVVLLYLPYITMEIKSGFQNSLLLLGGTSGGPTNFHFLTFPLYLLRFLTVDVSYYELMGYWHPMDELQALMVAAKEPIGIALSLSLALWMIVRTFLHIDKHSAGELTQSLFLIACSFWFLLFLSGKHVFPHYIQGILVFLFAGFGWLGNVVERKRFQKVLLIILTLACCFYGLQRTRYITKTYHAKNGLRVKTEVVARILEANPTGKMVHLSGDYPFTLRPFQVIAREQFQRELVLTRGRAKLQFELLEHASYRLGPAEESWPIGPVDLVRRRGR